MANTNKFSHYLDKNNNVKKMNHFQALKLSKDVDIVTVVKQAKKLLLEFHPDRNLEYTSQATLCTARITEAYNTLATPASRDRYEKSLESIPHLDLFARIFSNNTTADKKTFFNNGLDILLEHLEQFYEESDGLEKIMELYAMLLRRRTDSDEITRPKEIKIFEYFTQLSKTAHEFYYLSNISEYREDTRGRLCREVAAALGNPEAQLDMIHDVFYGKYWPLKECLKWSLNRIHDLEHTIIPQLERACTQPETIQKLKSQLSCFRERYKKLIPLSIPQESQAFNALLLKCYEYLMQKNMVKCPHRFQIDFYIPQQDNKLLSEKQRELFEGELLAFQKKQYSQPISVDAYLDRLNKLENMALSIESTDTLEKIIYDIIATHADHPLNFNKSNGKQLIKEIKNRIKTGDEYYAAYRLSQSKTAIPLDEDELLQKASRESHVLAQAKLTQRILMGIFSPLEASIKWGLECLRLLENTIIPKLEAENPDSETLKDLKETITTLRELYKNMLPEVIPSEPDVFNTVLTDVLRHRKNLGTDCFSNFILENDQITPRQQNHFPDIHNPLPINQPEPEVKQVSDIQESLPTSTTEPEHKNIANIDEPSVNNSIQNDRASLLGVLDILNNKINTLKEPGCRLPEKSINIAQLLYISLQEVITKYLEDRLHCKEPLAQLTKSFVNTCGTLINTAKYALEGEGLDWSACLMNLLKSLANIAIKAANGIAYIFGSSHQYTLFSHAKPDFVEEVECMELHLYKEFLPNKI